MKQATRKIQPPVHLLGKRVQYTRTGRTGRVEKVGAIIVWIRWDQGGYSGVAHKDPETGGHLLVTLAEDPEMREETP